MRYELKAYYDERHRGLADSSEFDDFEEMKDYVWEKAQQDYVVVTDTQTGKFVELDVVPFVDIGDDPSEWLNDELRPLISDALNGGDKEGWWVVYLSDGRTPIHPHAWFKTEDEAQKCYNDLGGSYTDEIGFEWDLMICYRETTEDELIKKVLHREVPWDDEDSDDVSSFDDQFNYEVPDEEDSDEIEGVQGRLKTKYDDNPPDFG